MGGKDLVKNVKKLRGKETREQCKSNSLEQRGRASLVFDKLRCPERCV